MAKRRTTPGAKLISVEIDVKVSARLDKFAKSRGEKKRQILEQALTRHMDSPPTKPALPPLPN